MKGDVDTFNWNNVLHGSEVTCDGKRRGGVVYGGVVFGRQSSCVPYFTDTVRLRRDGASCPATSVLPPEDIPPPQDYALD